MAAHNESSWSEEGKVSILIPASSTSTMKLPQMFRRSSAMSMGEKHGEKETRAGSASESERRSSLTALPLRLRRRKTQSSVPVEQHEAETA